MTHSHVVDMQIGKQTFPKKHYGFARQEGANSARTKADSTQDKNTVLSKQCKGGCRCKKGGGVGVGGKIASCS